MAQNTLWQPSDIVNADRDESEPPKRRGRIPQSAWPEILERHRAGATLTAIAREFDCTPSAISYIIRKAEAAGMTAQAPDQDAPAAGASADEGIPVTAPMDEQMPAESQATAGAEPAVPETSSAAPAEQRDRRRPAGQAPADRPRSSKQSGNQPRHAARAESRDAERPRRTAAEEPASTAPAEDVQAPTPIADPPAEPQRPAQARSEPIDAVEARLRDTARSCLVAYRGWRTQPGEASIQTLSDAMHELRKALARIEIDMSATRRDEQAQRPIPIPSHRASRRPR